MAVLLVGCGSQAVDSEGFTTQERNDAQTALDGLQKSNLPIQLVNLTLVAGAVPTCRVHLASRNPNKFDVYLFWIPYNRGHTYTWVTMKLAKDPTKDRFDLETAPGSISASGKTAAPAVAVGPSPIQRKRDQAVLRAHAGAAFSKPAARCQLLMNGYLRLLPAES
jgi:hypothetical protein